MDYITHTAYDGTKRIVPGLKIDGPDAGTLILLSTRTEDHLLIDRSYIQEAWWCCIPRTRHPVPNNVRIIMRLALVGTANNLAYVLTPAFHRVPAIHSSANEYQIPKFFLSHQAAKSGLGRRQSSEVDTLPYHELYIRSIVEHKILFALICDFDLNLKDNPIDLFSECIANIAAYADLYNLLQPLKSKLANHLLAHPEIWNDLIKEPLFYLYLSILLKSEQLYTLALTHAIISHDATAFTPGPTNPTLPDEVECLILSKQNEILELRAHTSTALAKFVKESHVVAIKPEWDARTISHKKRLRGVALAILQSWLLNQTQDPKYSHSLQQSLLDSYDRQLAQDAQPQSELPPDPMTPSKQKKRKRDHGTGTPKRTKLAKRWTLNLPHKRNSDVARPAPESKSGVTPPPIPLVGPVVLLELLNALPKTLPFQVNGRKDASMTLHGVELPQLLDDIIAVRKDVEGTLSDKAVKKEVMELWTGVVNACQGLSSANVGVVDTKQEGFPWEEESVGEELVEVEVKAEAEEVATSENGELVRAREDQDVENGEEKSLVLKLRGLKGIGDTTEKVEG
ncbi:hypothetical protein M501DRAFT_1032293 [Patellaria atrata CBS 101060]|uniref:Uncharacterized protein n=1 Tax=Patellaria atrata CBS 101060 TaxID=1346257 RepID=A0A9P4SB49_9PEZI|nr:hypothetical protein M501DRAFT_1032293 [Patellaria atrata CBS 101060]